MAPPNNKKEHRLKATHKVCKDCKKRKPVSKFYGSKRVNGKTYYSSYCKPCHVGRQHKTKRSYRDANFLRLWEHLKANPCVDCKEDNPLKLSFDHVKGNKTQHIGKMLDSPWVLIEAELKKCVTRCHNCHAVKTAASLNHFATQSLRDYVTKWPENKKAYEEYQ